MLDRVDGVVVSLDASGLLRLLKAQEPFLVVHRMIRSFGVDIPHLLLFRGARLHPIVLVLPLKTGSFLARTEFSR